MNSLYDFIQAHNEALAGCLGVLLVWTLIFGVYFLIKTLSASFDAADGVSE